MTKQEFKKKYRQARIRRRERSGIISQHPSRIGIGTITVSFFDCYGFSDDHSLFLGIANEMIVDGKRNVKQ